MFKNIDEIFETDIKRNLTFESFYVKVSKIKLNSSVPENIKTHFETARNLMLYSWFVSKFRQVAELHAFSSIELAIRTKIEIATNKKCAKRGLKNLLEYAVRNKWIVDEGFPRVIERKQQKKKYREEFRPNLPDEIEEDLQKHTKILVNFFPDLRNQFAHGSNSILNSEMLIIDDCRHLINQLFGKN
ncbi:MAG: hypothetical protein D8M61_11230 [Ignavibacteriae bacterium]|nr:hypothetical protein [Ignavibacteriota bacterium]